MLLLIKTIHQPWNLKSLSLPEGQPHAQPLASLHLGLAYQLKDS